MYTMLLAITIFVVTLFAFYYLGKCVEDIVKEIIDLCKKAK